MGCDIHAHVEFKLNGKWQHYSVPEIHRNYVLFARLANVRNNADVDPISDPRGLPNDCSIVTKFDAAKWSGDGHSHSWISAEECCEFEHGLFGWFFGSHIPDFVEYREDFPKAIQDVRVVFWFDN